MGPLRLYGPARVHAWRARDQHDLHAADCGRHLRRALRLLPGQRFHEKMATHAGMRWWDELEDCESWQDGTCVSINEMGPSSNHTADFAKNWQDTIARALKHMRDPAASRRPAEDVEAEIVLLDDQALVAAREALVAAREARNEVGLPEPMTVDGG